MHQGGLVGQEATLVYNKLGGQIDTLKAQQSEYNNNVTILSSNFGIPKTQAVALASQLGINLKQSLDPTQINNFKNQAVQSTGMCSLTTLASRPRA